MNIPIFGRAMTAQMMRVVSGPGRVVMGPKKLSGCYARIVSQKDGSGCIERYDTQSRAWIAAHESITFSEVWSAPSASPYFVGSEAVRQ